MQATAQQWWQQLTANAGYGPNAGQDLGHYGDGDHYLFKGYSNVLGDVRDYFTDWRGDLIAKEQNDLAKQTLEHQMNMDLHGTEIRAQDFENAGLSKYGLAGAPGGQGSSVQAPQLAKPGRGQAMREGLGQMLGFGQILASISKTKAEEDAIRAQIPGHRANSQYLTDSIQARLRTTNLEAQTAQYTKMMAQYNVSAAEAEAMARYYRAEIDAAWHRYGGQPGAFAVQTWNDRRREMWDFGAYGGTNDLNIEMEWLDPAKVSNPEYRQAVAEMLAIEIARIQKNADQYNLDFAEHYQIRENQTNPLGMLLENVSGIIDNLFNGRKK